jgi:hypothetical protein
MTGEQASPFALTTLQRVKDLLFDPSLLITITATTTEDSPTLTDVTLPTGKTPRVGQTITGTGITTIAGNGIPVDTVLTAITSGALTMSQNATASGSVTLYIIDQPVAFDLVLTRLINWATNFINNECGRNSFVQQTYVNDTYSATNPRQKFLILRNTPVFPAADGIHVTEFSWRAGTPSNPNWTDFIPDQYELVDPRTDPISGQIWYPSGMIRIYGVLPRIYNNMIRASYVGGYPVNWANPEDHNTHWLPGDITNVCENLVVRRFKRRQLAGQTSMSLEGAQIAGWRNDLDAEDREVLGQYKDVRF